MKSANHSIRIVSCLAALGFLCGAHGAFAQEDNWDRDRLLQGDYAYSQLNTCVETSPGGFDRDTLQLQDDGEITTFATSGVTSFDGKGRVTVSDGEGLVIFQDQTAAGDSPVLAPIPFSCEGSYSVADDLSFDMEIDCSGDSPPFLQNGPVVLQGHVSRFGKTLIFTANQPVIETLSVPGLGAVGERICAAMATDIRAHRIR